MTENIEETPIIGIKFNHVEDGVIDINSETAFTHLLAIGAVVKSRKRLFGPDGRSVRIE